MTELSSPSSTSTPQGRLRLRKACKLRHLGLVNHVFAANGRKMFAYPVRMVWEWVPRDKLDEFFPHGLPPRFGPVQMLITVPKKQLRHAVDRVLMRRRIREAFRLNRHLLGQMVPQSRQAVLAMAFIYISPKLKSFATVEKAMCRLLGQLAAALAEEPAHQHSDPEECTQQ